MKILIAYSSKPPIMTYLSSAFERLGIETAVCYADNNHWFDRKVIHVVNKWLHNFRILPKSENAFSDHPLSHRNYRSNNLLLACRKFCPDVVLHIRGIGFREDTLKAIRENSLLFGWWIEREERVEEVLRELHLYDWYFFMNSSCVEAGKNRGFFNTSLLLHSVDPDVFYPLDNVAKEIDICFVASWSPKRQKFIEALFAVTDNIVIYGGKWLKKNPFNLRLRRCVRGKYIEELELIKLYNKSRIVLNVTNWGFGEGNKRSGMNMRILEVPASGAFLLTDGSRDMEEIVIPGKHVAVYDDLEDCVKKAGYYLGHDGEREEIAAAGCRHVRSNYTYDDVAKYIIAAKTELENRVKGRAE